MAFLLDTNVVSELRRPRPDKDVVTWFESLGDRQVSISTVTCGEIQRGIEKTREQNPAKANEIEQWLDDLLASRHLIAMDESCFRQWARLMHKKSNDQIVDAMIAATAIVHRLVVVTRNVRDFEALGVDTINPWTPQRT